MINVVVLGLSIPSLINVAGNEDLNITVIDPDTIDSAVLEIKAANTDITVLEQHHDRINTDILCLILATNLPQNQTIILSDQTPDFEQLKATGFRARGYITPSQHDKLVKAIRAVHDGEAWLPRRLVADMLNHFAAGDLG
ncbi:MAG: hypothetical protein CMH21_04330 [Methylophaga sp.]|jgi:DNA-binding NarL/FixJ family response regulator|nr:hypothetical protein [Methylophaga sp.]MAY16944.1 hypothetical protein [Methylophaga sp.]MBN46541.1 hypothetical protein [Methylophaga sp.]HCD03826.1 hypothetical protein [Methylophaga sp.]|tara:strand:- start:65622 stop:66041 length:420 start_codon:yes stop_codon:yes gene_type:complete